MAKRNFYIRESEMDDFQRKVINRRSESSLIVRGCAGSGKSVIAFWRLHDIVSNDKGSAQMIVYTKSLKEYFVEGCRGEGINPSLIDHMASWKKSPKTTDYILVDEVQDFSASDINMFKAHAKKALLLYGDSSQQIFSFLASQPGKDPRVSMDDIQRLTGYPTEQLVFNHRLPVQVARVAEYVNKEGDDLVGRCTEKGDEKPFLLRYPSPNDQLNAIVHLIKSRGLDDVGILLPKNELVESASDYLASQGLNVERKYNDRGSKTTVSNLNFATSNPKVMTYHSAKGLQFRAVFLPECEARLISSFLEPLYVAMTRTYQSLYVLYSDQIPTALQRVPDDLYERSIKTRETEVL